MINGRIVGRQHNGDIIVRPDQDSIQDVEAMIKRRQMLITMEQFDTDRVTPGQKKIAHALINDINSYSNNDPLYLAENDLKFKFCISANYPSYPMFSLANCSKRLASLFISFLVEYCFKYDIPFDGKELHLQFNLSRMMFLSAVHNRCFATQALRKDATLHIHHVNAIGRGKRASSDHRGRYYMILRAELHQEIHELGYWRFCDKWHCGAVKLSDEQLINMHLMSQTQMTERDSDPDYQIKDWQLPERKNS